MQGSTSASGSGNSVFSTRLQRIIVYGLVIFGVVPLALGLLLLFQNNGAAAPFLTTYYIIAILGLAVIMFEQLSNEIRKPQRPAR